MQAHAPLSVGDDVQCYREDPDGFLSRTRLYRVTGLRRNSRDATVAKLHDGLSEVPGEWEVAKHLLAGADIREVGDRLECTSVDKDGQLEVGKQYVLCSWVPDHDGAYGGEKGEEWVQVWPADELPAAVTVFEADGKPPPSSTTLGWMPMRHFRRLPRQDA